jgi:hypothetical protein
MSGASSRYEPGSAGRRARDGVEAPVRPVISGAGGIRQRLGLVAVAAVAVSVLAAGFGLSGTVLIPPPSPTSGSAAPSVSGPQGSGPTAPTPATRPTALPGFGCVPVDLADLPSIYLVSSSDPGDRTGGVPAPPDLALATPQTLAWPVPRAGSALILSGSSSVVVVPQVDECMRYAVAEYLSVDDIGGAPTALGLGESNVNPPRTRVVLGGLPLGDWIVRVVVYFTNGVAGDEDKAVVERFFRVTTDVNPAVSPEVTPAVPCRTPEPGESVGLWLALGDREPVLGVDLDTYGGNVVNNGAVVEGALSDALVLHVGGDACATSWTIQWLDPTGSNIGEMVQLNSTENPFLISQNRIVLSSDPEYFGHLALTASVQLGRGRLVRAAWELDRTGPPTPPILVSGPAGEAVEGLPTCGTGVLFTNGKSSYELCEASLIPEAVRLLTIQAGDVVTVEAPGQNVTSWSVTCGTRGGTDGREFVSNGSCDLGGGVEGPIRFLPYAGRSVIQVYVDVERDGATWYAAYFVEILAEP